MFCGPRAEKIMDSRSSLTTTIMLSLVWFYGISPRVGYVMPNLVYTYILDIYGWLVGYLGFMAYQPFLVI